jgi:hypothetical protein
MFYFLYEVNVYVNGRASVVLPFGFALSDMLGSGHKEPIHALRNRYAGR